MGASRGCCWTRQYYGMISRRRRPALWFLAFLEVAIFPGLLWGNMKCFSEIYLLSFALLCSAMLYLIFFIRSFVTHPPLYVLAEMR